ncbi:hypothetical protein B0H10DRAFT_1944941 [Mycena sp. CBHHK59/15]|nr:hypothetical protein B0H10DRAFT_1944941 [Mycena sp. CBHHK59/15]
MSHAELMTGHTGKLWKVWKARQDAASAMIIKGLDNSQIVYVRSLEDDLVVMWEKLQMVHEPVGLGGAIGLWLEFFTMKYDASVPMKTFLGRVTGVGLVCTLDNMEASLITLDFVQKKILMDSDAGSVTLLIGPLAM